MKVLLDAKAVDDLQGIFDWIAEGSPRAADTVISRIFESVERLGAFPELGRIGRDPGTREWVIPASLTLQSMRWTANVISSP